MEQKRPRWVDKPEFDWTPQPPLNLEPSIEGANETAPESVIIDARSTGLHVEPDFVPANDALPRISALLDHVRRFAVLVADQIVTHVWQLGKQSGDTTERFTRLAIAPRLAIGLGQGLLLCILFFERARSPSIQSVLAGLIMAATFAPLLLMQGLERIPPRALLVWTCMAALGLAGLGVYHDWRVAGTDPDHAALWLVTPIAGFLFIGQALFLGHARSAPGPLRYGVLYESTWRLMVEVLLCGLFALCVWSIWRIVEGWLPLQVRPQSGFAIPLVTFSLAAASQLRAGSLLHLLKRGSVILFTAALPLLVLSATITILFGCFSRWQPPLGLCGLQGALLIVGINASYRGGGEWRPQWRRRTEFVAALLLPPLALLGTLALHARIAQFGFTAPRVVATACTMLFWAYALAYAGAALISLGGGRWMERIESANLLMAFVAMSLIATLASPLGDPVRLAVASQNWRMAHGRVAPEAFDYSYLRRSGLRFGRDVLAGHR
ncbi:MAG: hypothetical protein ABI963_07085 [Rhizomicrobium sp.]